MNKTTRFDETTTIRFFKGDRKERQQYINAQPERWENDSAFIRSACKYFMRKLDTERYEPKSKQVKRWASMNKNGKNSLRANSGGQK